MSKPTQNLPHLDDAAIMAKVRPLTEAIVPKDRRPSEPRAVNAKRTRRLAAAEYAAEIERIRGPRVRFGYLIPERVGEDLARKARERGMSASVYLLHILKDAGINVIPEDFIDLRRERGE